jgi:hypothetical protein
MKQLVLVLLMVTWGAGLKAFSGTGSGTPVPTDTTTAGQPLRLRSFNARILSANRIELSWLTAETWANVTHYEIQRSYNSTAFETIGSKAQTDNRPIDQYYRFTDESMTGARNNIVYYRLKQVNRDGKISYSFIVPVKFDEESKQQVAVWPVPVKEEMTVAFSNTSAGEVSINLADIAGKKVKTIIYQAEAGRNTVQIGEINGLNAGVYIVQIWIGTKMLGAAKFLKIQ